MHDTLIDHVETRGLDRPARAGTTVQPMPFIRTAGGMTGLDEGVVRPGVELDARAAFTRSSP
ncbi:hypothetical protein ACFS2C_04440 [Prauserella oleivorans]|uniref:Uncharacterized protein n=1 Tax=Prauserella oleivorans TaxID=1478153 RepID=A0ABW5W694_9PSEU